jgi:hypothetical protein
MTTPHLSELALERHLLGLDPPASPAAAHLQACPPCSARLAEMRAQGEDFARYVFPATVDRVEEAAGQGPRRSRWMQLLAPASALAAAAAVFLLVQPQPDAGGPAWDGVKGEHGLGLSVFLAPAGGAPVHVAREGERVSPAAALRFRVQPTAPCHLWLVSVDAAGQVSRLFPPPAGGDGGAPVAERFELPGGAVLDGKPGPERVIAICTPGPTYYAAIERAVQVSVARGEPAVRSVRVVPGLPEGTAQASVLLEKGD